MSVNQSAVEEKQHYVFSLDYDGCTDIAIADLEQRMVDLANAGHQVTIMVGSNRQDIEHDVNNSRGKGSMSVFKAFQRLSDRVKAQVSTEKQNNVEFDKHLQIDSCLDTPSGSSMAAYLPELDKDPGELDAFLKAERKTGRTINNDESKISMIYNQLHHMANKAKQTSDKKTLQFTFTDDRPEILQGIQEYFNQHADLIPEGVTLHLEHRSTRENVENREKSIEALLDEIEALSGTQKDADTCNSDAQAIYEKILRHNHDYGGVLFTPNDLLEIQKVSNKEPAAKMQHLKAELEDIKRAYHLKIPELKEDEEKWKLFQEEHDVIIKGKGEVDTEYHTSTREMLALATVESAKKDAGTDMQLHDTIIQREAEKRIELFQTFSSGNLAEQGMLLHNQPAAKAAHLDSAMLFKNRTNIRAQLAFKDYFKSRAAYQREYNQPKMPLRKIGSYLSDKIAKRGLSRTVKLQATLKVMKYLEGQETLGLTREEKKALNNGQLKRITDKYKSTLSAFLESNPNTQYKKGDDPKLLDEKALKIAELKFYQEAKELDIHHSGDARPEKVVAKHKVKQSALKKILDVMHNKETKALTKEEASAIKDGRLKALTKSDHLKDYLKLKPGETFNEPSLAQAHESPVSNHK